MNSKDASQFLWRYPNAILGFLQRATGQTSRLQSPPAHRNMDELDELEVVAEDTISRTPEIIAATPGASADSTFHDRQLPALNKDDCPNFPPLTVRIEPLDAFTTARKYIQKDPSIKGKVAVLNLASDQYRAGGWRDTLCKTQVRRTVFLPSSVEVGPERNRNDDRKRHCATLQPCTLRSRKNTTHGQTSDLVQTRVFTLRRW